MSDSNSLKPSVVNDYLRMCPTSTLLPLITPPSRFVAVTGIDNIPPNTRINNFHVASKEPALLF